MNNQNTFTTPGDDKTLSEEEIKALNIPPRDEVSYPMPSKEDIEDAGRFLFKLNLMASSLDLNLQAIIWDLYVSMNKYLHYNEEGSSIRLAMAFETLKEYLVTSNNPVFKDQVPENKTPEEKDK